jgi:release factor glutamine methyltransferase
MSGTDHFASYQQIYRGMREAFRAARLATPELDARVLLMHAAGMTPTQFALAEEAVTPPEVAAKARRWQAQRLAGTPVSRLLGAREFYGRVFKINRHVLDPRPDSEVLVDAVLAEITDAGKEIRLLDLGTGSGCLIISLLAARPNWSGLAMDASRAALRVARLNAHRLGVRQRMGLRHSHWLDELRSRDGCFDVIVSNPPYIARAAIADLEVEVRAHDPIMALEGGTDGLRDYRTIIASASAALTAAGKIYLEIGHDQGRLVSALLAEAGFYNVRVKQDLAGHDRLVIGKKRFEKENVTG